MIKLMKGLLFCAFVLILTACNKEEDNTIEMNAEEAAEIVEQALVSDTYGMTVQVEEAAVLAEEMVASTRSACGISFDTSFVKSSAPQAIRTFSFQVDRNYTLVCNGNIPVELQLTSKREGSYNTPRLSSDDTANYQGAVTNLSIGESQFMYNGSVVRQGTQAINVRRERGLTSTLTINSQDILIDKNTRLITAGSSEFTLTGTFDDGRTFDFAGLITYKGNRTATVMVNGNTYDIQL